MNIFLRELKANLKSLIIWSFIIALFTVMGFSKFTAYYENPEMLAVLKGLPQGMLDAFGMNAFNLTTLNGFFGIMIPYFGMMLAIAAAMWGSNVISKEERDRTVEFSLTLPVTRSRLVTGKLAAMLVDCILLLLITWGVMYAVAQQYNPTSDYYTFLAVGTLSFFILQCIFLALGVFLACLMRKHKRTGSIAVFTILGTYFLSILIGLNKDLEYLRYLTPFKYFDPVSMLKDSSLEIGFVLLSIGIIAVLIIGAYFSYNKRDLYIWIQPDWKNTGGCPEGSGQPLTFHGSSPYRPVGCFNGFAI